MSPKTLLIARPASPSEWLEVDRLCNGLMNWSDPLVKKSELPAAPFTLLAPSYSRVNFALLVAGERALPWELLEDMSKNQVTKVFCFGTHFQNNDKKRLAKIFTSCEDWVAQREQSLPFADLPL